MLIFDDATVHVLHVVKIGQERHTKSPFFQLERVLPELETMGSAERESGAQKLVRMTILQKMNLPLLRPNERVKGPRKERHLLTKAWSWMKMRTRMAPQKHLKKDAAVQKNSLIVMLSEQCV